MPWRKQSSSTPRKCASADCRLVGSNKRRRMADQERQAVIVGAGVIGCAIALQLARRGYRTINIDKNADVGYGSTSNSCAIVRFSFSTLEGVTLASEGLHYWMDWPNFLGTTDERGFAQFK